MIQLPPGLASRPLVVTADDELLDVLLRLAAAAGVEIDVAADPGAARPRWAGAPLVVVAADQAARAVAGRLGRRKSVVLVAPDTGDDDVWRLGVELGVEQVLFLPDAEQSLAERFAEAADGTGRDGVVLGVLGGRGGVGATVLAGGLSVTGARRGVDTLLVDADPLGGGIDLVLGAEHIEGRRWPDFADTRGRVGAAQLQRALPRSDGLTVLSWDRSELVTVHRAAMSAVLNAARRGFELVVLDLPRRLDAAAEEALTRCACTLLVVAADVRSVAAAARVVAVVHTMGSDVRVVVRGPAPSGLRGAEVADALGLPLAVEMEPEPRLDEMLERGDPPARAGRGPLARACHELLDDLLPAGQVFAA